MGVPWWRSKRTAIVAAAAVALMVGGLGIARAMSSLHAGATHPGLLRLRRRMVVVAADAIGVKAAELRRDIEAGRSVADVATARGIPVDTVVNAVVQDISGRIDRAVSRGKLTQAKADAAEARLATLVSQLVTGA